MDYNTQHSLIREKLWADVYATRMMQHDMAIEDAAYYASRALDKFDEAFPTTNNQQPTTTEP